MESSSYFIKDKAIFGSYPNQQSVYELEKMGVKYFVDLTLPDEKKIVPYITTQKCLNFPIYDQNVPMDLRTFFRFILQITRIIRELRVDEKIYIHCKGGHGRAGLVVACILCYIFSLTPYESLQYTSECHNNRKNMRERWRKIGSPQTYLQKKFVYKSFNPVNMNVIVKHLLSEKSLPENKNIQDYFSEYKEKFLENSSDKFFSQFIKKNKVIPSLDFDTSYLDTVITIEWDDVKDNILRYLILNFFNNNTEVKEHFMKSFLRPIIITYIEHNVFWKNHGIDITNISNILKNIRVKFLQDN